MTSILELAGFILACFLASATGALFRPGEWYERLKKPTWRPPNRLFAPVWTGLYLMIAVSGWLVWREVGFTGAVLPLAVYALQLLLNAAWTPIFFGLHRPDLALVDIVLVWLSIVATIVLFLPLQNVAAFLLIPYLAWVSFATALNFAIWRLNRSDRHGRPSSSSTTTKKVSTGERPLLARNRPLVSRHFAQLDLLC